MRSIIARDDGMQKNESNHRSRWTCLVALALAAASGGCVASPGPDPGAGAGGESVAEASGAFSIANGPHATWRVTSNYQDRTALIDRLTQLDAAEIDIDAMVTDPNGEWLIVDENDTVYRSTNFPSGPHLAVGLLLASGQHIHAMDFNANGGWVVVGDTDYLSGGAVPQSAIDAIEWYLHTKGWAIRDVEITNSGYLILGSGSTASYSGIDADLAAVIADRASSQRTVQQVEIGFDGSWAVVSSQAPATKGVSTTLATTLQNAAESGAHVSRMMLGVGTNFVVYSHGTVVPNLADPMEVIEYDLDSATGTGNLWKRLEEVGMPGVSVAIIDGNQVVKARSYGVIKQGEQRPVLASTPFDLASLSKYLGALTVLRARDLGWLTSLDNDVLTQPGPIVSAWKTAGSDQPDAFNAYGIPNETLKSGMTLRHILRHRAGVADDNGSPGFWAQYGADLGSAGTLDLMLSWGCSGGSCDYKKGLWLWTDQDLAVNGPSVYASRNYLLAQAIAEDAAGGVKGATLLANLFFTPMGLQNISGAMPLPAALEARAAWQHGSTGTPISQRVVYPWTFAGGVYASAADYAEMLILALNEGRDSHGVQRVAGNLIAQMLNGQDSSAGFGMFFETNFTAAEGTDGAFNHNGAHGGQSYTRMCGNPTRGQGIVVLTNASINAIADEIVTTYARAAGWPAALNCR